MAWTTPKTWSISEVVTAALLNTHLRDNLNYLKTQVDGGDGWTPAGVTWTYASASTFTVSGDVTAVYRPGTKLKFTQTTDKYAVVASSSYSAPNTTVTIIVNTDYTIANAAITAPYFAHIETPSGFPASFNYTPTFGGFSSAPTAGVYIYSTKGREITVSFYQLNSGTSNATTYTITAPVAAAASPSTLYSTMGIGIKDNSNPKDTSGLLTLASGASTINCYTNTNPDAAGAWTNANLKRVQAGTLVYYF